MADNYLENKMDEYRRGVNSAPRRVITPQGTRPGHLDFTFPPRRVLVVGASLAEARHVMKQFAATGCKVAFCDVKGEWGADFARRNALRFYPVDDYSTSALAKVLDDIVYRWHGIDIVVAAEADSVATTTAFSEARRRNPMPTDYAGRLVCLADSAPSPVATSRLAADIYKMDIPLAANGLSEEIVANLALFFATEAGIFL